MALFVSLAPTAPIPPGATPTLYYPTTVGARWVYQRNDRHEGRISEDVRQVIEVKKDRGAWAVSVGLVNAATGLVGGCYEKVIVSPTGLTEVSPRGGSYAPREILLKVPFKTGDKWETDGIVGAGGKFTRVRKARGVEEVDVPAGKIKAMRVDAIDGNGTDAARWSYWYAPHIGPVRWTYADSSRDIIMSLKSFAPGRD